MEINTNEDKYIRAKERVKDEKEFYNKVISSSFTIAVVAAINYYVNEFSNPWFLWVVLGVGISLVFKAVKVFNVFPFMGKDWEQKKINQLMKEDEETNKKWR
ncbi:2TM domain-containing protein [Cellulophaga sp. 20_2_10]|uniref:2TM domain-containing protein n=1 Tax=Cellulophaga sp. 20_2_10 TaxID=2942476 RepID=UPI00201B2B62|nr:2TM domain-containing protein [Cellulophaga sp. 20_2_10]MCL5244904.1 2TM domain-containing protein [Cellulophaga sp. 20_2_10]